MKATKAEMAIKQQKRATPVNIKLGDHVMIQHPERKSKFSHTFIGLYRVVRYVHGNKFEVMEPNSNVTFVVHSVRLKSVQISSASPMVTDNTHAKMAPL